MKICVFTDIHGNLPAFNKLMQTDDFKCADVRICLGDIVMAGPYPNECCEALLKCDCIWVLGNHDSYVANGLPEEEYNNFQSDKLAHQEYMDNLVKNKYKVIMKGLPKQHIINVGNKKLYFTHYPWESQENVIDSPKNLNLDSVSYMYKDIDADYIFYGHEHKFLHFQDDKKEYICVGSLGLDYPGHYLMINIENNYVKFEDKILEYDLESYKQDLIKSNCPRVEVFVEFFEQFLNT